MIPFVVQDGRNLTIKGYIFPDCWLCRQYFLTTINPNDEKSRLLGESSRISRTGVQSCNATTTATSRWRAGGGRSRPLSLVQPGSPVGDVNISTQRFCLPTSTDIVPTFGGVFNNSKSLSNLCSTTRILNDYAGPTVSCAPFPTLSVRNNSETRWAKACLGRPAVCRHVWLEYSF